MTTVRAPFKKPRPGEVPAVVMMNPRYPHNVGAAVRACSCFDVSQVWVTGTRVAEKVWAGKRLPREERMKGFSDVDSMLHNRPLDHFPKGTVPVAVELLPNSENLYQFEHPANAVYVFGPEDGSVDPAVRALCHRRVFIPTRHCTNLAAAVYLVLYDRKFKQYLAGAEPLDTVQGTLNEVRMWPNTGRPDAHVWDIALE